MKIGRVTKVDIEQEMQASYLDYAMSVIVARALPDVQDGLKPVHRRILFAMYDMGLTPDKPYKKSARIVGEVLGKYHPHGDSAVYDAMVRMAQSFSLRYPLVDGQGNFGSVDDDAAAAMRYTEARLQPVAMDMLQDMDEETVDFGPNFDGSLAEPLVLPAVLPNLLVNGTTGIAVGMSTNVPPHNMGEIIDALVYMLDQSDKASNVALGDLLKFIHGPDFPTGGLVYRYRQDRNGEKEDVLRKMYATGRGNFTIQARTHFEVTSRGREQIIITELPYQTNKTRLIERIAQLARSSRIEGITDLRDESDRSGMRVVIELNRNASSKEVLAALYRHTAMRQTFGAQFLALVKGEPRLLSLRQIMQLFIEHRTEVVTRRTRFRLNKARHREHILAGLLIALQFLDEVIQLIRRSRTTDTARKNLIKRFHLSEIQAQAILDMPLKRLSALERKKIDEEHAEVLKTITHLEGLLADPTKIRDVIRRELLSLKEKYNDNRRTLVTDLVEGDESLTVDALLPANDLLVWINRSNVVNRLSLSERRKGTAPGRGPKEAPLALTHANSQQELLVITGDGRAGLLPVHLIPKENGVPLQTILPFGESNGIAALLTITEIKETLLLVSRLGRVKQVGQDELISALHNLPQIMRLESEDRLIAALPVQKEAENILLISANGKAIRFAISEVRIMGLAAAGVLGMKLSDDDYLVGALLDHHGFVWLATEYGFAKRMPYSIFAKQKRYGMGIVAASMTRRSGRVVAAMGVPPGSEVFVVTEKGNITYLRETQVPRTSRTARGNQVIKVNARDRVLTFLAWHKPEAPKKKPASATPKRSPKATPARTTAATGKNPNTAKSASTKSRKTPAKHASKAKKSAKAGASKHRSSSSSSKGKQHSPGHLPAKGQIRSNAKKPSSSHKRPPKSVD